MRGDATNTSGALRASYSARGRFILGVALPVSMIVSLALLTFFTGHGRGDASMQFGAILTSALTVTNFRGDQHDLPTDLTCARPRRSVAACLRERAPSWTRLEMPRVRCAGT